MKNTRLSQQVMSDSLLHRPQNKGPPPTLLIPAEVCESAILSLYPCKKILQNGESDSHYSLQGAI